MCVRGCSVLFVLFPGALPQGFQLAQFFRGIGVPQLVAIADVDNVDALRVLLKKHAAALALRQGAQSIKIGPPKQNRAAQQGGGVVFIAVAQPEDGPV